MDQDTVTLADVKQAAREYAEAATDSFWGWVATEAIARKLYGHSPSSVPALHGQVTRTLDAMSGDGKLLRRRLELTGHGMSRALRYTPAVVAERDARRRLEAESARYELGRAWQGVNATLARAGYLTTGPSYKAPDFDLDAWERLADALEGEL